jgi:hypothetical protein
MKEAMMEDLRCFIFAWDKDESRVGKNRQSRAERTDLVLSAPGVS